MKDEFEMIYHPESNYNLFLVNLLYRAPHIHKDFEVCLLLEGEVSLLTHGREIRYQKNSIWIHNPYESHELKADSPALILVLQFSPAFFRSIFPLIERIQFALPDPDKPFHLNHKDYYSLIPIFLNMAHIFFKQEGTFRIRCAGMLHLLFDYILTCYPYKEIPETEYRIAYHKALRLQKISNYIDTHFTEKLLLSDIAKEENLTLSYLSHFFKDSFGMPFQEYLTKVRCEKAHQLLLLTDFSLLDISLSCGFSDLKYFNKGFKQQYGCSPKEYRLNFEHQALPQQQKSMLSTQEFLSPDASLILLNDYFHEDWTNALWYT